MTTGFAPHAPAFASMEQADEQFSFAPQIDLQDHKTVGVSFRIGDGPLTTISTPWEI
jgi:hypothetical protein